MRIGIIGAGISGLNAALAFRKQGHEVAVFQKESGIGGLIGTFDFDGVEIEHFYHFLCQQDEGYFALCRELGLAERVRFAKARTGFYYDGHLYPFTTPLDLLRFSPLPFAQRLRFGFFALEARLRKEWLQLDELRAKPWIIDRIGRRAYDVVWEPLLALKFGAHHESISAAWVWHRLHRVAKSKGKMGYLEGGTGLLLRALLKRIEEDGVTLYQEQPVTGICAENGHVSGLRFADARDYPCDRVVSTVPLSALAKLLPPGWEDYAARLARIQYIGVACVLFKLRRPVSQNFWLNVHDNRVPFNGIIEYTNLNPLGGQAGHLVYVPYYLPVSHPIYQMDDADLVARSWAALRVVQPALSESSLIAHHVARAPYAQAICTEGFLKLLPEHRAPLAGLHLLDSTFLYPEDRTQSGHILKAWECAKDIADDSILR